MEERINNRADQIQDNIQASIKALVDGGELRESIQYQDIMNVFLIREIARLQILIEDLQTKSVRDI